VVRPLYYLPLPPYHLKKEIYAIQNYCSPKENAYESLAKEVVRGGKD
jgi:hypothetical protein